MYFDLKNFGNCDCLAPNLMIIIVVYYVSACRVNQMFLELDYRRLGGILSFDIMGSYICDYVKDLNFLYQRA